MNKLTTLILSCIAAATAYADVIPIDLGPTPRWLHPWQEIDTYFPASTLTGHMEFDFAFSDLIQIWPREHPYFVLRFDTTILPSGEINAGDMSATFLDRAGNPLGPLAVVNYTFGSGIIDAGGHLVYAGALDPHGFYGGGPLINAYGMRWEFDVDGTLAVDTAFFRIGASSWPGLVIGTTPDTGSTLGLLALGCCALLSFSRKNRQANQMKGTK